jgi:hypothetical protein
MSGTTASVPAKTEPVDRVLERVIIGGDLSGLSPLEKTKHYVRVCHSMGLNPSTQPFAYLKLQGKETLYALKGCTDQLRNIHSISVEIIARELTDGIYTVRARSSDPTGRHDEDEGIVPLADTVKGEFRSNLMMKATTKAKRRVTLSHCGLGFLDESEIEAIRGAETLPGPTDQELTLAQEMQDEIPHQQEQSSTPMSGSAAEQQHPTSTAAAVSTPVTAAVPNLERMLADILALNLSIEDTARECARRGGRDLLIAHYKTLKKGKEKERVNAIQDQLVQLYPADWLPE